jgi:hypothetical protein
MCTTCDGLTVTVSILKVYVSPTVSAGTTGV